MIDYEAMQRVLAQCRPEAKDILLARILRGETVDITKDEDLFYQVNKDRVSLHQFTNRDKFKESARDFKKTKDIVDPSHKSPGSHMRLIGEIPAEIYFARPEFSPLDPNRAKNIKKWLNEFPAFRLGDKQV